MKKNRLLPILLFPLALGLVACSSNTSKKVEKAQEVEIFKPFQKINSQIVTSGYITANDLASIGTRIMGRVNIVYVHKGQQVNKGQLLVAISDEDLKSKLIQTQANEVQAQSALRIAKKDEQRYKNLLASKSVSQKEYEQIHLQYISRVAQYKAATAMVKEIEANRTYTQIRAPFSGLVSAVQAKEGMLANPGTPLLIMERKGDLVVQTQVNERVVPFLKKGADVLVELTDNHKIFKTKILEFSRSSVTTGGNYLVTLSINKDMQQLLISGMFVKATFNIPLTTSLDSTSLTIPSRIIIAKGGLKGVYVLSAEREAILHWLRLGRYSKGENGEELVEVLSGLSANDTVIVPSVNYRLENGLSVIPKQ